METKTTHCKNQKEAISISWTHNKERELEEFNTRKERKA